MARVVRPARAQALAREVLSAESAAWLFGAGLAGGVVTAIVGGASLIVFPAMLAAGLPAVIANASCAVALTPANLIAGVADLGRRPRWDRAFAGLALIAIAGGVAGAVLLLLTPEKAFTAIVPVLIGAATVLFAAADRIRGWLARRAGGGSADGVGMLLFAPVAVYGGYFGAGMSVMLLAILSVSRSDEFRANNVVKNLLSGLAWLPTLATMAGGLLGGFVGGRLAGRLPAALLRWIVITVGSVLTVVYARRYW